MINFFLQNLYVLEQTDCDRNLYVEISSSAFVLLFIHIRYLHFKQTQNAKHIVMKLILYINILIFLEKHLAEIVNSIWFVEISEHIGLSCSSKIVFTVQILTYLEKAYFFYPVTNKTERFELTGKSQLKATCR